MSSNTTPGEIRASDAIATGGDVPNPTGGRSQFDVERRLLCARIEALEAELARERRRRKQVVDRYERLLERRPQEPETDESWFRGLF